MARADFLWVEKWRPHKVADCVVPQHVKKYFANALATGDFQHLLLYSASPGTGKTTIAKALCDELGYDYIVINGSDEGRLIDTMRVKIRQFASTVSFTAGAPKVVIIDEADGIPPSPQQESMRGFIEEFSANCRFIYTANYPHKIIEPIRSRLNAIDFSIPKDERKDILIAFSKRCCSILDSEGIAYDKRFLAEYIAKNFPDFRTAMNGLQRYASYNENGIDDGILYVMTSALGDYIKALKAKDFQAARKWLAEHNPEVHFYSDLLNELYPVLGDNSIALIILAIGEYAYKHSFVADPQVNLAALTVEIMAKASWK